MNEDEGYDDDGYDDGEAYLEAWEAAEAELATDPFYDHWVDFVHTNTGD